MAAWPPLALPTMAEAPYAGARTPAPETTMPGKAGHRGEHIEPIRPAWAGASYQSSTRSTAPGFSTLLPVSPFSDNSAFSGMP